VLRCAGLSVDGRANTAVPEGVFTLNPYEVLDLPTDATESDIREAYRILARQHHPDITGDPEAFLRIKKAHDILIDPNTRAAYDVTGLIAGEDNAILNALTLIRQITMSILNDNPNCNILEGVLNSLSSQEATARASISQLNRVTDKWRKAGENITARWRGGDRVKRALLNTIESSINEAEEAKAPLEAEIRKIDLARKQLDDSRYEMPESPRTRYSAELFGSPAWQVKVGGKWEGP